jgi:hypothetical protein
MCYVFYSQRDILCGLFEMSEREARIGDESPPKTSRPTISYKLALCRPGLPATFIAKPAFTADGRCFGGV